MFRYFVLSIFVLLIGCANQTTTEVEREKPAVSLPATHLRLAVGTYAQAKEAAVKANKEMLVVFGAEWCVWCKKMEAETFSDPTVKEAMHKYYYYYVDTDKEGPIAAKLLLPHTGIPAYAVVDPHSDKVLKQGSGFKTIKEFIEWLRHVQTL